MRTLAAVAAAALTLAGCTADHRTDEGSPPVAHIAVSRLPEQPAHDPDRPLRQASASAQQDDAAAVAVAQIVAGLTEQGLEVVDLGVQTLRATPDSVTVRVAVTHQPVAATPHTSVYELDLARGQRGPWRLAGFRQPQ